MAPVAPDSAGKQFKSLFDLCDSGTSRRRVMYHGGIVDFSRLRQGATRRTTLRLTETSFPFRRATVTFELLPDIRNVPE